MSCYAIKISRSKVSVSTTTSSSYSFRIYEVTKMTVVGCSSSSTCTHSFVNSFCGPSGANCDGRSKSPHITFMQSALPCDLTKPPVVPETWKQIYPSQGAPASGRPSSNPITPLTQKFNWRQRLGPNVTAEPPMRGRDRRRRPRR